LNDVNVSFLNKAVLKPFKAFMCHPGWWSVLIFMFLYRLQDNLIGNMPTLFYLDLGFSKGEIAACQKVFGMWMSVLGGILGGALIRYQGYFKALCIGGIFHGLSGFCYVAQAWVGDSLPFLYVTTAVEDFSKGIAIVSLFSYQLTCCQKEYAVTQLALLTSFVNLSEVSVSSFSGFLADSFGWKWFFAFATTLGFLGIFWIKCLPALFLIRPRKESFR
jgi:PAT family beta-lactamase induction signal transducer AmpG